MYEICAKTGVGTQADSLDELGGVLRHRIHWQPPPPPRTANLP